jgi:hypothetical protein
MRPITEQSLAPDTEPFQNVDDIVDDFFCGGERYTR